MPPNDDDLFSCNDGWSPQRQREPLEPLPECVSRFASIERDRGEARQEIRALRAEIKEEFKAIQALLISNAEQRGFIRGKMAIVVLLVFALLSALFAVFYTVIK